MATAPEAMEEIVVGRLVLINGLQAKPEYNGQLAVVTKYLPEKERWAVNLPKGGKQLSVKQQNIVPPEFVKKSRKKYLALEVWPTAMPLHEVVSANQIPVSPMTDKVQYAAAVDCAL